MTMDTDDVVGSLQLKKPSKWLNRTYALAVSLNLALAIWLGVLLFAFASNTAPNQATGPALRYYIQRASFRLTDFLHVTPLSRSHYQFGADWPPIYFFVRMISIPVTVLACGALLWIALSIIKVPLEHRRVAHGLAGLCALLGFPAAVVFSRYYTFFNPANPNGALWFDPLFRIFLGELIALLFAYAITTHRRLSKWLILLLASLHCIVWLGIFYDLWGMGLLYMVPFLIVFPIAAMTWALHDVSNIAVQEPYSCRLLTAVGFGSVAILVLLWLPSLRQSSVAANRATVTMQRTPCFGRCPSYQVTVHSDGSVEYLGRTFVRVKGRAVSHLVPDRLASLLQAVNDPKLRYLDDRAFDWCFDTAYVSLTISDGAKQTTLWSDVDCSGPRGGPQRRVVDLADSIDQLVDSRQWVQCANDRCEP